MMRRSNVSCVTKTIFFDGFSWIFFRGFPGLMVILICTEILLSEFFSMMMSGWHNLPFLNWCENPNRKNRKAEYWKRKEIRAKRWIFKQMIVATVSRIFSVKVCWFLLRRIIYKLELYGPVRGRQKDVLKPFFTDYFPLKCSILWMPLHKLNLHW